MKLKFCGMRQTADVDAANLIVPDYMGMILTKGFRRSISLETAKELISRKAACIKAVGVFVNEPIEQVVKAVKAVPLDVVQLHGDEDAAYISHLRECIEHCEVWKAVRVRQVADVRHAEGLGVDKLVLEGYAEGHIGGSGLCADWSLLAVAAPKMPYLVAGGICAENAAEAMRILPDADGLDVSSGIEINGSKDLFRMNAVAEIVKGVL